MQCQFAPIKDLSPLKDLPNLQSLYCSPSSDQDYAVLRELTKLTKLNEKPVAEFWKGVDKK
jgi:hypothetical protein